MVVGEPISGGKIDEALGRHPRYRTKQAVVKKGKNARTFYKIVEKYRGYSLLEASLSTGSTHQIRAFRDKQTCHSGTSTDIRITMLIKKRGQTPSLLIL